MMAYCILVWPFLVWPGPSLRGRVLVWLVCAQPRSNLGRFGLAWWVIAGCDVVCARGAWVVMVGSFCSWPATGWPGTPIAKWPESPTALVYTDR